MIISISITIAWLEFHVTAVINNILRDGYLLHNPKSGQVCLLYKDKCWHSIK